MGTGARGDCEGFRFLFKITPPPSCHDLSDEKALKISPSSLMSRLALLAVGLASCHGLQLTQSARAASVCDASRSVPLMLLGMGGNKPEVPRTVGEAKAAFQQEYGRPVSMLAQGFVGEMLTSVTLATVAPRCVPTTTWAAAPPTAPHAPTANTRHTPPPPTWCSYKYTRVMAVGFEALCDSFLAGMESESQRASLHDAMCIAVEVRHRGLGTPDRPTPNEPSPQAGLICCSHVSASPRLVTARRAANQEGLGRA